MKSVHRQLAEMKFGFRNVAIAIDSYFCVEYSEYMIKATCHYLTCWGKNMSGKVGYIKSELQRNNQ